MMRVAGAALALALLAVNPARAQDGAPLQVYGNLQTIELAPVLYAADEFNTEPVEVKMGGIANLVGAPGAQGFTSDGQADLATNAETQLLRYSVDHPDLRILMNVTEGLYRVVARRSSGIRTLADLKGKRVATIEPTSAGYFLDRMLGTVGLSFDDITAVPLVPLSGMTEALRKGEVDAVAIWEPEGVNSEQAIGDDAIVFDGDGVYAELFNLNTTAAALADPAKRARIVRFVRSIIDATAEMKDFSDRAQQASVEAGKFSEEDVRDSWEHHRFNAKPLPQMLDVLEAEEQWLAARDKRTPRSREQLATLIDTSVYQDALALETGR